MDKEFSGCPEEMYRFFWELAFQNNKEFFEANRSRYVTFVREPMHALARTILPAALEIDPEFDTRVPVIVSRIRRDTRYSRDKSPYRDHVWLGFKPAGAATGETFMLYAEFERTKYGYGMGMYQPNPAVMAEIRSRIIARPDTFLTLVNDAAFRTVFTPETCPYVRKKFSHADAEIETWLNQKSIGFHFSSPDVSRTFSPDIADELLNALRLMQPVYRFLKGLD